MKLRNKKTGEIVDVESLGHADSLKEKYGYQVTLSWRTEYENLLQCKDYNSLAELNEEWEDYEPVEPEIADQTARETIRKWYNKNRIVGKLCSYGGESWLGLRGDDKSGCSWKIELHVDYFSKLKSNKLYSLTELCGENEDSEHELDSEEQRANEY